MRSMILATLLVAASTATAARPTPRPTRRAADEAVGAAQRAQGASSCADHKAPVVTVQVFYHAGGKDEPADKRGIAHMFEHMMFKGSTHVPPEEHARFIELVGGDDNAFTAGRRDRLPRHGAAVGARLHHEARGRAHAQPQADAEDHRLRARGGQGGAAAARREQPDREGARRGAARSPTRCTRTAVTPPARRRILDTVTPPTARSSTTRTTSPTTRRSSSSATPTRRRCKTLAEKYFGPLAKGPPPRARRAEGAGADRGARRDARACRCSCR